MAHASYAGIQLPTCNLSGICATCTHCVEIPLHTQVVCESMDHVIYVENLPHMHKLCEN